MSRSSEANKLCPWIESLVLSYSDGTEQQTHGRLKAHVVGVGDISQSQSQTAQQGTTELIFLSDGVVQIPAVLTASALADLQEREDREGSAGLVDATVRVLSCRLCFHAHPREQSRSRFYLSVGRLATVAAGPRKERPPPCTTLFSVRQHICRTWRLAARHHAGGGSRSGQQRPPPCGLELSELLGTWDTDDMRDALAVVPEMVERGSPPGSEDSSSRECTLLDKDQTAGLHDKARSNPWDAFPPPIEASGSSPRSDGSMAPPEAVPPETPAHAGVPVPLATSTQASSSSSDVSQTSERSKGDQSSCFPPYQNPQPALSPGPLSHSSASGSTAGSLSLLPHTKKRCSQISTHPLPLSGRENPQPFVLMEKLTHQEEEVAQRKRKRKLHHCNSSALPACVEEEGGVHASRRSPPSWLFDRQEEEVCGADGPKRRTRSAEGQAAPTARYSAVHSDGTPFSYAYKPARQLLLDLSRFKVPDSTLQWAAKYLKSDG